MPYTIPTYAHWPYNIPDATETDAGVMSPEDKQKLDLFPPPSSLPGVNGSVLAESPPGSVNWLTPADYAAILAPFIAPLVEGVQFNCDPGLPVGALVRIDFPDHVAAANAASIATAPAIGFVNTKPTPTTAIVTTGDAIPGFAGLVPGQRYFLAVGGGIAKFGDGSFPSSTNQILQRVGTAINATTLLSEVDPDFIILA